MNRVIGHKPCGYEVIFILSMDTLFMTSNNIFFIHGWTVHDIVPEKFIHGYFLSFRQNSLDIQCHEQGHRSQNLADIQRHEQGIGAENPMDIRRHAQGGA